MVKRHDIMTAARARLLAAVAVLLVIFPMFVLNSDFYHDWINHKWILGYVGEYFWRHGRWPIALNTHQVFGIPFTIFYGSLYYPCVGLLSHLVYPGFLMRLAFASALAWQIHRVSRVAFLLGWERGSALALGCWTSWSVYGITGIYFRSAHPEFFASIFLVACLTYLWEWKLSTPERRTRAFAAALLCYSIFSLIHPITALYGSLALATLVLPWALPLIARLPSREKVSVLAILLLALLTLVPWIWLTLRLGSELSVSHQGPGLETFPQSIDWIVSRFFPIAFDRRVLGHDALSVATPYLDAQVSLQILIAWGVLLGALWRRKPSRGFWTSALIPLLFFLVLLAFSLDGSILKPLPEFLSRAQFSYRMVGFMNVCALGAIFWVSSALQERGQRPALGATLVAVLTTWAALNAFTHALEANAVRRSWSYPGVLTPTDWTASLTSLPEEFYGNSTYSTPGLFRNTSSKLDPFELVDLDIGKDDRLGEILPQKIHLERGTWIGLRLEAFAWNQILIDGNPVPAEKMALHANPRGGTQDLLAAWVEPGDHEIGAVTRVPVAWGLFHSLIWVWLAGLALISMRGRLSESASALRRL